MKKREFITKIMDDIYRMCQPYGATPPRGELRDLLQWVYREGQYSKEKLKSHAVIMGKRGGSVSSDAKKKAAREREEVKRKRRSEGAGRS